MSLWTDEEQDLGHEILANLLEAVRGQLGHTPTRDDDEERLAKSNEFFDGLKDCQLPTAIVLNNLGVTMLDLLASMRAACFIHASVLLVIQAEAQKTAAPAEEVAA